MSPAKAVRSIGVVMVLFGGGWVLLNLGAPDTSLWLGLYFLLGGLACVFKPASGWMSRLAMLNASLAVIWLLAEAGVRIGHQNRQNAFVAESFRWIPGSDLKYDFNPGKKYGGLAINRHGMWGPPTTHAKPAGTYRIVVLGDSVMADGRGRGNVFARELQRLLNQRKTGKKFEVLNFGVPGYNTLQEAAMLREKALGFSPDLILLAYVLNDPYPDLALVDASTNHSRALHYIEMYTDLGIWFHPSLSKKLVQMIKSLHRDRRSWNDVVVGGFNQIEQLARQRNTPVAVVIFPLLNDFYDPSLVSIHQQLVREAKAHHFASVDLRPVFARYPPRSLVYNPNDIIHPNPKGHLIASREVFKRLGRFWR